MSISAQINALVTEGRLHHIEPLDPSLAIERVMVVTDDIRALLEGPWSSDSLERRAYRLRADLEHFVRGQTIALSMTPHQHKTAYMGLLAPPEGGFWDIRSRDPQPGLRVLGHFAETNLFVAMTWHPRSVVLDGHPPLGGRHDLNWELAKLQCEDMWKALLPGHQPKTGAEIGDFISDNRFLV